MSNKRITLRDLVTPRPTTHGVIRVWKNDLQKTPKTDQLAVVVQTDFNMGAEGSEIHMLIGEIADDYEGLVTAGCTNRGFLIVFNGDFIKEQAIQLGTEFLDQIACDLATVKKMPRDDEQPRYNNPRQFVSTAVAGNNPYSGRVSRTIRR